MSPVATRPCDVPQIPPLEPAPCVACAHEARCARAQLACESFLQYVRRAGGVRFEQLPRVPSRVYFLAAFRGADDSEAT